MPVTNAIAHCSFAVYSIQHQYLGASLIMYAIDWNVCIHFEIQNKNNNKSEFGSKNKF